MLQALPERRARAARRSARVVTWLGPAASIARSSRTHDHRPSTELPPPAPLSGRSAMRSPDDGRVRRGASAGWPRRALDGARRRLRSGPRGRRPVPSAGALYPLELYVIAAAVNGLDRGIYHFNPFRHRLARLASSDGRPSGRPSSTRLCSTRPPLLVVVTAVFGDRASSTACVAIGSRYSRRGISSRRRARRYRAGIARTSARGFLRPSLDGLLGADGLDEAAVHAVVIGGAA